MSALTFTTLIENNFMYIFLWIIVSILTFPTSVIFHELGHCIIAKIISPRNNTKAYFNILPRPLSGGSTFMHQNKNLSEVLENKRKYKTLILLYSFGFIFQILYVTITTLLIALFVFKYINSNIYTVLLQSLAYFSPQIIFTIANTFGKNEGGTNDRTEIKKYKQIIKTEKENNKRKTNP